MQTQDKSPADKAKAEFYSPVKSVVRANRRISVDNLVVAVLIAATIIVLLFHLAYLTAFPPVFIDEPWYTNSAWNWLQTGQNVDTLHVGLVENDRPVQWPNIGYLANLVYLPIFATMGLGFFQARFASWILGVILVVMTALVGWRRFGRKSGALAAFLLATSQTFLQVSHYARPDILMAVVGISIYLLVTENLNRDRAVPHLFSGLFLALAIDIHPNAVLYAIGTGAIYLLYYGRRTLKERGTWLFGLGFVVGLTLYVVVRIVPDIEAYQSIWSSSIGSTHKPPALTFNPVVILASLRQEIGRFHFYENALDFVFIGASAVYLTLRRMESDRFLVVYTAVVFLSFVAFVGNKHDVYAIMLYPFLMIIVAEVFVSLIASLATSREPRAFVYVALGLLLVSNLEHLRRPLMDNRNYDYDAITESIRQVLPPGARVMGLPNWWLGLSDYDYVSSLSLTFANKRYGDSLIEGMAMARPDYLIVDGGLRGLLVDEGYFPPGPGFEVYKLPRQEFDQFLANQGSLIKEFPSYWHGRIDVFSISWE